MVSLVNTTAPKCVPLSAGLSMLCRLVETVLPGTTHCHQLLKTPIYVHLQELKSNQNLVFIKFHISLTYYSLATFEAAMSADEWTRNCSCLPDCEQTHYEVQVKARC